MTNPACWRGASRCDLEVTVGQRLSDADTARRGLPRWSPLWDASKAERKRLSIDDENTFVALSNSGIRLGYYGVPC
jgi:hypothetical protein